MNILSAAFHTILYQPLLNALILLYVYFPGQDFGVAVIILTLLIKIILFPGTVKSIRSQRALSELQPKMKEIQEKYKTDKQAQSRAMMELYKTEKINPLSGCLPLLLQLPILIALYQVFLKGLTPEVLGASLYAFTPNPGEINMVFLGILNLAKSNIFLAFLAGALQFLQMKIASPAKKPSQKKGDFSAMFQNQMIFIFPIITVFIVWKLGSLIGLYWAASALFSIIEHYFVLKEKKVSVFIKPKKAC